jgi:hypothetical protein
MMFVARYERRDRGIVSAERVLLSSHEAWLDKSDAANKADVASRAW